MRRLGRVAGCEGVESGMDKCHHKQRGVWHREESYHMALTASTSWLLYSRPAAHLCRFIHTPETSQALSKRAHSCSRCLVRCCLAAAILLSRRLSRPVLGCGLLSGAGSAGTAAVLATAVLRLAGAEVLLTPPRGRPAQWHPQG